MGIVQTQEVPHRGRAPRGARQRNRKYYHAHRETIRARQAEANKTKQAAMKAGQKATSLSSFGRRLSRA